jgi:hypothetical protein
VTAESVNSILLEGLLATWVQCWPRRPAASDRVYLSCGVQRFSYFTFDFESITPQDPTTMDAEKHWTKAHVTPGRRLPHCLGLNSPGDKSSRSGSVADRASAKRLMFRSHEYRLLILASATSRVEHATTNLSRSGRPVSIGICTNTTNALLTYWDLPEPPHEAVSA